MRAVVTGATGFVGSRLCSDLLARGDDVIGIDSTDGYSVRRKYGNVAPLLAHDRFSLHQVDLVAAPLTMLFSGVDVVFHLAGHSGARPPGIAGPGDRGDREVLATQLILEALRRRTVRKLVHASSSAVYGNAATVPMVETQRPQPSCPRGVRDLASEHLCAVYREEHQVRSVSLRLFTVYGPQQRRDSALTRLVDAAARGEAFHVFGDGEQTRDFVHVSDVVDALIAAAESPWTGVANIGSGVATSINEVIRTVSTLVRPVAVVHQPAQPGDVRDAVADISLARQAFAYDPQIRLATGLLHLREAAVSIETAAAS